MNVIYNFDTNRAEFEALRGRVERPEALMKILGREGANRLKAHFRKKDREEPSALGQAGDRRQHFWLQIMRSVQNPELINAGTGVSITISDPRLAQKIFGGTIRAKRASMLTIPVTPEAYGRAASVFEKETGIKLIFIVVGKGEFENAVLASKRDGGLQTEYVLTPSVDQKADPTALPDQAEFEAALLARGQAWADRLEKSRNQQTPETN